MSMLLMNWLQWLETQNSQETSPSVRLDQLKSVAEKLELKKFPIVITVTGTNGKGSCVALLESIYRAAGYQVGSFTSPHLFKFNERIRINKKPVDDEMICRAFNAIKQAQNDIVLNYFQYTFLAALMIFQSVELDLIILEVGIGGQYDAVNIIDADLALIASIGLDHCELLGTTREDIAINKAGIMRKDHPAVCGDENSPNTLEIEVKRIGANLSLIQRDFFYQENNDATWEFQCRDFFLSRLKKPIIHLTNAAAVIMGVKELQSRLPVSENAIKQGLIDIEIAGRFQIVQKGKVKIVFDVAHNPHASQLLADRLKKMKSKNSRMFFVISLLKEKDSKACFSCFLPLADRWYIGELESKRATPSAVLERHLKELNADHVEMLKTVNDAFEKAYAQAGENDIIVVTGSFLSVSTVMEKIKWT